MQAECSECVGSHRSPFAIVQVLFGYEWRSLNSQWCLGKALPEHGLVFGKFLRRYNSLRCLPLRSRLVGLC